MNASAIDRAVQSVDLIPDMNKEPPIVAERENSIDGDKEEASSQATQSKNVEHFLNTNLLRECKRIWSDSETNSRSHVKRLKTNTSDISGNETKSMMVFEEGPSSGKKVNYFFHRIFGINKPGSRRYQKSSTSQIKNLNMGGGEDVSPWIQRWCKQKAA
ncbi:unnamed protein product [Arabidopsis lyrata]|nr:unnamed protein product [Arabidopsis lyrata]